MLSPRHLKRLGLGRMNFVKAAQISGEIIKWKEHIYICHVSCGRATRIHNKSPYLSIKIKPAGFLHQPVTISSPSGFCSNTETASDRMTPFWYPCRRVWESESHYLFNAPAGAAQPHPGGVKLHFWPRYAPPGQFGEEHEIKGNTFLFASFSSFPLPPPLSFFLYPVSPDAELCKPRQWEYPRNPCQGAQLWHYYPGKGEDPGCGV